ncbi:hypothetical protein EYF80_003044 [Liparis tanakae]|uniref:Uncharacterized protein n=1 Tax=Liparis tanakae TaxID=230148 RepID=A0A4Z2JA96_9TELE|nr:hypothetical protein EYF80_003044 [Liparis tanakae]
MTTQGMLRLNSNPEVITIEQLKNLEDVLLKKQHPILPQRHRSLLPPLSTDRHKLTSTAMRLGHSVGCDRGEGGYV